MKYLVPFFFLTKKEKEQMQPKETSTTAQLEERINKMEIECVEGFENLPNTISNFAMVDGKAKRCKTINIQISVLQLIRLFILKN